MLKVRKWDEFIPYIRAVFLHMAEYYSLQSNEVRISGGGAQGLVFIKEHLQVILTGNWAKNHCISRKRTLRGKARKAGC